MAGSASFALVKRAYPFCLVALCIALFKLVMPMLFEHACMRPAIRQMHVVLLGVVSLSGAIS